MSGRMHLLANRQWLAVA